MEINPNSQPETPNTENTNGVPEAAGSYTAANIQVLGGREACGAVQACISAAQINEACII